MGMMKETTTTNRALLDYNTRAAPRLAWMWAVCRIVGLRARWIRTDRTRRGWHVVIEFSERFTNGELVALQAILESDKRREALNLMRVIAIRKYPHMPHYWKTRWNILYAEKL